MFKVMLVDVDAQRVVDTGVECEFQESDMIYVQVAVDGDAGDGQYRKVTSWSLLVQDDSGRVIVDDSDSETTVYGGA